MVLYYFQFVEEYSKDTYIYIVLDYIWELATLETFPISVFYLLACTVKGRFHKKMVSVKGIVHYQYQYI